jgi:hypothetical protein
MKTKPKRSAGRSEVAGDSVVASFVNFARWFSWVSEGFILFYGYVPRGGSYPPYIIVTFNYDGTSLVEFIWMFFGPDIMICYVVYNGLSPFSFLWFCVPLSLLLMKIILFGSSMVLLWVLLDVIELCLDNPCALRQCDMNLWTSKIFCFYFIWSCASFFQGYRSLCARQIGHFHGHPILKLFNG